MFLISQTICTLTSSTAFHMHTHFISLQHILSLSLPLHFAQVKSCSDVSNALISLCILLCDPSHTLKLMRKVCAMTCEFLCFCLEQQLVQEFWRWLKMSRCKKYPLHGCFALVGQADDE